MTKELEVWVKDILTNDEVSTDEELVELFTRNGVKATEAREWVEKRMDYMGKI